MKKLPIKNTAITAKTANVTADALYERIAIVIREARATVVRSIDTTMVKAYWHIGKYLVEEEQKGAGRAEYGNQLLKTVSVRLNQEFGKGFSATTLEDIRKFYLVYSAPLDFRKPHAVREELAVSEFSPIHLPTEKELEAELKRELNHLRDDLPES